MTIEYRGVEGFPAYRVGNDGSIWSRWVLGRYKRIGEEWRRIRGRRVHGHRYVTLHRGDGTKRGAYLHRVILEAFVGPCPAGMECCHRDDDPENNVLTNLRWDTSAGNKADIVRRGRSNRGTRHPLAKLDGAKVRVIRSLLAAGAKHKDIARRFGIRRQTVGDVALGRRWGWLRGDGETIIFRRHGHD